MTEIGTKTEDNLLGGLLDRVTQPVTIVSGQNLERGAILGKITSGGKYKACNSGNADGSEVAECILAEDVDASSGDMPSIAYLTGEFNGNALSMAALPSTDTIANHKQELRLRNIFVTGQESVLGTIA